MEVVLEVLPKRASIDCHWHVCQETEPRKGYIDDMLILPAHLMTIPV
jgi:hypothetical protein